ncbi:T9SS type A sorting domain-containing protein [Tenacibaculum sp. Mcav3-52]|uniref:T9SS type A sorting domain-containing protein n=1 Tax=unclassified Tenacibaculum TaxID=2635139 RepID=UPI0012E5BF05|nr:T9SS type A sorting domain-containing protein [Tenacibaculum sp. Mcav3-52]MCG7501155.1 T9SS type A sorting domain-containing protein [Tenacibaculum sp. Mcav3-52]GFD80191.1 hypothetical protein KUL118_30530 [Tenacibaculum sp. KUL118]
MKKLLLNLCAIIIVSNSILAQTELYFEDFEDITDMDGYQLKDGSSSDIPFQSANSGTDYILRDTPSTFNMPTVATGFTGMTVGFEDVDVAGGISGVPYIQTDQINITNYESLNFEMRIAAPRGADGNRFEVGDEVRIEASIDGGAYNVIGRAGGAVNRNYYIDVNNDGITGSGDDVLLTAVSQLMNFNIVGTGSTLDLRIYLNSPDPQEEVVIDDIKVQGSNTLGTDSLFSKQFSIYPNPTSSKVNLNFKEQYKYITIAVGNVIGQSILVKKYSLIDQISFDINGKPGIYFIKVSNNLGESSKIKIIKR